MGIGIQTSSNIPQIRLSPWWPLSLWKEKQYQHSEHYFDQVWRILRFVGGSNKATYEAIPDNPLIWPVGQ